MASSYIKENPNTIEELSLNALSSMHKINMPFLLPIPDKEPIFAESIVRLVPKKRVVIFGSWNAEPVVIKMFYSRNAKRHFERELNGLQTLLTSGVPAPRILFEGIFFKKRLYVIVLQKIVRATNLEKLWLEKESVAELIPIMELVTIELATQHVLGIVQKDFHFKNFLLLNNQIYTVDAGSIQSYHSLLPKKQSIKHLALFFSQLGVGTEQLHQHLFKLYYKLRGWIMKPADMALLRAFVKKWNGKRIVAFQKKLARSSSTFLKIKNASCVAMIDREYLSLDFKILLKNPEVIFTKATNESLKSGNSSTVIKTTLNQQTFVIKRYNIKNAWHWVRRSFRKTRAANSFRLANLLRLFDIPTPKPIAYIEKRFLGLRKESYFVMEHVTGKTLGEYFQNYQHEDAHFEKIAMRVLALIKNITLMGLSHGDLKASNILIANEQPVLIDLDGMKKYRTQRKADAVYFKELKRFLKNWDSQPDIKHLFEKLLKDI